MILTLPRLVDGSHINYFLQFDDVSCFCGYWIILGIASTIGYGTGLLTFVFYLYSFIAKAAYTSYDCGVIPEHFPSKWNFQYFQCPISVEQENPVNFFDILLFV